MRPIRLQTEYLTEPLGLGIRRPELSWNCRGGVSQSAYRVVARKADPAGGEILKGRDGQAEEILWDSGRVESSSMTHIPYGGAPWDPEKGWPGQ